MKDSFKEAYLWHLAKHGPRIADFSRATGVSRDVLNKFQLPGPRTTSVENGLAIAAYFGKTLEQFMRCDEVSPDEMLHNLAERLLPSEQQVVISTMTALLQARRGQSPE